MKSEVVVSFLYQTNRIAQRLQPDDARFPPPQMALQQKITENMRAL